MPEVPTDRAFAPGPKIDPNLMLMAAATMHQQGAFEGIRKVDKSAFSDLSPTMSPNHRVGLAFATLAGKL